MVGNGTGIDDNPPGDGKLGEGVEGERGREREREREGGETVRRRKRI